MSQAWNALNLGPPSACIAQVGGSGIVGHIAYVGQRFVHDGKGRFSPTQIDQTSLQAKERARFYASLVYQDGSTAGISALLFQDGPGNLLLAPSSALGADATALMAQPVVAVRVGALATPEAPIITPRAQCFVAGTLLQTPTGARRVETLEAGDLVSTLDHGPQPIRWRYSSRPVATGKHAPVCIPANSLGKERPQRDLWVSQHHRMFVSSSVARDLFGAHELLVPATRLAGFGGVRRVSSRGEVSYLHLLLDRHEILLAEGVPTESLLPGQLALETLSRPARIELQSSFPTVGWQDPQGEAARPVPPPRAQYALMSRILQGHGGLLDLWQGPPL